METFFKKFGFLGNPKKKENNYEQNATQTSEKKRTDSRELKLKNQKNPQ